MSAAYTVPACTIDVQPGLRVRWTDADGVQRGTVIGRWSTGRLVSIRRDDGIDQAIGDWVLSGASRVNVAELRAYCESKDYRMVNPNTVLLLLNEFDEHRAALADLAEILNARAKDGGK